MTTANLNRPGARGTESGLQKLDVLLAQSYNVLSPLAFCCSLPEAS